MWPLQSLLGCALFSTFLGLNPLLVDLGELITRISSFLKLDKKLYFIRYCNKRKLNEKRLEAKVNFVQIQKT